MNETNSRCLGVVGRLLGHNYQARYDETTTQTSRDNSGEKSCEKKDRYVMDVCKRCGDQIKRPMLG